MSRFQIAAHDVQVSHIAAVEPLIENSRIVQPEAGLILRLDNGKREVWRAAKGESIPLVSDVLVSDPLLGLVYVVPAAKFAALFTEV